MAAFGLTDVQAEDILEIRLRQLARLEGIKIENELKTLKAERKGLKHILADAKALSDLVVAEIEADAARFGDARRTLIEAVAPVVASRTVPDEPITVTLSRNGWIRSRQGHGLDAAQFAWKAGDEPLAVLETRTVNGSWCSTRRAARTRFAAPDVPGGRGDGVPVTTLIDLQARRQSRAGDLRRARAEVPGGRQRRLRLRRVARGHGVARQRAGKAFMTLAPGRRAAAAGSSDGRTGPRRRAVVARPAARVPARRDARGAARPRRHHHRARPRRNAGGGRPRAAGARSSCTA